MTRSQFIGQEEGRIRKKDSTALVYDYFIKDHLGNARMLLTEEQQTDMYPAATMETADMATDTTYYSNINATRSDLPSGYPVDTSYSNPNNKVAKVNGSGNKIGPAIVLKVMAGDEFSLRVSDWYKKNGATPEHTSKSGNGYYKCPDRQHRVCCHGACDYYGTAKQWNIKSRCIELL